MGTLGAPLHLLPLCKAFSDNVIHRRLDEARTDSISLVIALAVVGDERLIVGNVGVVTTYSKKSLNPYLSIRKKHAISQ
jgi:hypothetical protein